MNLIDNGVEKFISFEKIDDADRLGYEVVFVCYYGQTVRRLVNTMTEVKKYQDCKVTWRE